MQTKIRWIIAIMGLTRLEKESARDERHMVCFWGWLGVRERGKERASKAVKEASKVV